MSLRFAFALPVAAVAVLVAAQGRAHAQINVPAAAVRRTQGPGAAIVAPTQGRMPNVVGMTATEAAAVLRRLLMTVVPRDSVSPAARGTVVAQQPAADAPIGRGGRAILMLSTGTGAAGGETTGGATKPQPRETIVPDVRGLSLALARIRLFASGLRQGVVDSADAPGIRPGRVVSQEPQPGSRIQPGLGVRLVLARHVAAPPPPPPPVQRLRVPDVTRMTVGQARTTLGNARFLLGDVDSAVTSAAAGTVVRQAPAAGDSAEPGTFVHLTVAQTRRVAVPPLVGLPLAGARNLLFERGLRAGAVSERQVKGATGQVLGQSIAAGKEVAPGMSIDLVVSRAPVVQPGPGNAGNTPRATGTQHSPPRAESSTPPSTSPRRRSTHSSHASRRGWIFPIRWILAVLLALLLAGAAWTLRRVRRTRGMRAAPAGGGASVARVRVREVASGPATSAPERVERVRARIAVHLVPAGEPEQTGDTTALDPRRIVIRTTSQAAPASHELPDAVLAPGTIRIHVDDGSPTLVGGPRASILARSTHDG